MWFFYIGFLDTYSPENKINFINHIIGYFLYPRIDKDVTTNIKHLLRLPFSVNSKSGNLCLPIKNIDCFDVSMSLSIRDVVNSYYNHKKDLLKEYIDYFNEFYVDIKKC